MMMMMKTDGNNQIIKKGCSTDPVGTFTPEQILHEEWRPRLLSHLLAHSVVALVAVEGPRDRSRPMRLSCSWGKSKLGNLCRLIRVLCGRKRA